MKDNKWRVAWDASQGWLAAALIGLLTALVAFLVDVATATISDYKVGFCTKNPFSNRESCCTSKAPLLGVMGWTGESCEAWRVWSTNYYAAYAIYVAFALLFVIIAGSVTMTTKTNLPAVQIDSDNSDDRDKTPIVGKSLYLAAGSGIPEIKTILSGFVIPHFLDFNVLVVKAVGATFAVSTGLGFLSYILSYNLRTI